MKQKRLLRIFAAAGLVMIMGAGVLYGSLISMNTIHSKTSASEDISLTPQEQLLNGTLNFDPENDPVIFTTDYGLEIKSHNVGEVPVSTTSSKGSITVSSTNWNYISAGGYNWIIIGSYSSSSYTISTIRGDEYPSSIPDKTDAGNALESASNKALLKINNITIPKFTNAVTPSNGEIPYGCVLCLCAGTAGESYFDNHNPSRYSYFPNSDLDTAMSNVYNSIKSSLKILPTSLTTYGYDMDTGTITTYTHSEYLFPLATNTKNSSQNFCVETYLNSTTKQAIGSKWWLRTGEGGSSNRVYFIAADGGVAYGTGFIYYTGYFARPAFVLQLYSA